MNCTDCGAETVAFDVPSAHTEHVPGSESTVGLCIHCLTLQPLSAQSGESSSEDSPQEPDFGRVSDAFPSQTEGAISFALLVGLLDNLALYRAEITELLEAVEESGTDPLLALDRLQHDPTIETDLDLSGRRRQLEQLL